MPRPLIGRGFLAVLSRIIVLGAVASVALVGFTTFRIWEQGQRDERPASDAIVVMGAAQYDGAPSPILAARLDHAIELFQDGVAPRLIVTGGKAEGDRTTEAASGRDYAVAHGVPAEAILSEERSRTTIESIRGVATLMADAGLDRAVFVSDRSHMLRVLQMASDNGIQAYGSPTQTSPLDGDVVAMADAFVHELGALAAYLVTRGSP